MSPNLVNYIGFGAIDVTKAYEFIGFGAFYFQFWFQYESVTLAFVKKCTPSRREGHIGQEWVPGERQSRLIAEKHKNTHC